MITWHQLPGLLVSNPTLPGLVGSPNNYWLLRSGLHWKYFYFPKRKVRKFPEDGGVMAVQKHRRVADGAAWVGQQPPHLLWFVYVCCQGSPLSRRSLDGALSDARQSECVMWVCDCAHHMLVAGWFNSTHTPPTIKTRFLDVSNWIWRESAGLLFINRLTFANQMESSWLRSQEKLLFALFEVCDKCP